MEKILHKGFRYEAVPENFVFPPEQRPKKLTQCNRSVPVIDLGDKNHDQIVRQILDAGKDFGIFQVVNHGVGDDVMSEIMRMFKEFFDLPPEERATLYSDDLYKPVRLFTSTGVHDVVRFWRDCLRMAIYPVEDFKQYWPESPSKLKEAVENYAVELRKLTIRVLGLVADGLGLDLDYFEGDLSGEPMVSHFNFYPPCPDPSLTLGLAKHCDPGLLTILLQGDVCGLQVLYNDEWVPIDPIPNALVINYGHQMEIISNGMLKGVNHRAITNAEKPRLSVATFVQPAKEGMVAPAAALQHEENPQLYKSFLYREYFAHYVANLGDKDKSAKPFLVNSS